MENSKFIESSGLLCGFHYHDQIITHIYFENNCVKLGVKDNEKEAFELQFKGVFNASIANYLPGSIINSCFIWEFLDVPDWVKGECHFLNAVSYCSIDSKFLFYMISSYGASAFIPFGEMILTDSRREIIWEI